MNSVSKLHSFLSTVQDTPFTVGGKPDRYVIRELAGFGFHVEDNAGNLVAVIDDYESSPEMLVLSADFFGDRIKKKVSIHGIHFLESGKEVAA